MMIADGAKIPPQRKRLASLFVEGFNAADAAKISAQSLRLAERESDKIEGDRAFRPVDGYSRLVEALAQECILCSTRDGALRVSLHYYNTPGDVDAVLAALDQHPELVVHGRD